MLALLASFNIQNTRKILLIIVILCVKINYVRGDFKDGKSVAINKNNH